MLREDRARACDTCRSAACTVYCHADSAYLCTSCDAQVHSANRVASRHKRVKVCESCERAPAAFLCEADDASLCTACDSEVHSANPLARRHQRVLILPISGNSYISMAINMKGGAKEAASWLLPYSDKNNGFLFSDEYLDLADYKFTGQHQQTSYGGDRVVPLQLEESRGHLHHNQQSDITYGSSGSYYSYNGSINHNASTETDFLPESIAKTSKGTIDQLHDPPTQLTPMDKEARVLRYREKRKTRRFEKTIRYASRKAYAERRPRINGRFAKSREIEAEEDNFVNLPYQNYYVQH